MHAYKIQESLSADDKCMYKSRDKHDDEFQQ